MVSNCPDALSKIPDDDGIFDASVDEDLTDTSDDEVTLNEEESLAAEAETSEEMDIVQRENTMPLDDLLVSCNDNRNINNNLHDSTENTIVINNFKEDVNNSNASSNETDKSNENEETRSVNITCSESLTSELEELFKETGISKEPTLLDFLKPMVETDDLNGSIDSEGSIEYDPDGYIETDPDFVIADKKDDWKNSIMVGKEHQAKIPELTTYDKDTSFETRETLLWDPKSMTNEQIEQFLYQINLEKNDLKFTYKPKHIKDDPDFLNLLLKSDYNPEKAIHMMKTTSTHISDKLAPFSESECLNFENGITQYGKDFWKIQQTFVKTRTVSELVHFYYLWKKTERHDVFVIKNRPKKNKYLLNPGSIDYMDRFFKDSNKFDKQNCIQNIPGIIQCDNDHKNKCNSDIKVTRSKTKLFRMKRE